MLLQKFKATLLGLSGLVLVGCSLSSTQVGNAKALSEKASNNGAMTIAEQRVQYQCLPHESIQVRFFPNHGVAVLVLAGETFELQQQRTASGFYYKNSPNNGNIHLRGKGQELTLQMGQAQPFKCTALHTNKPS